MRKAIQGWLDTEAFIVLKRAVMDERKQAEAGLKQIQEAVVALLSGNPMDFETLKSRKR